MPAEESSGKVFLFVKKKRDEKQEVFYERVMLLEDLEALLAALYTDFVVLC